MLGAAAAETLVAAAAAAAAAAALLSMSKILNRCHYVDTNVGKSCCEICRFFEGG